MSLRRLDQIRSEQAQRARRQHRKFKLAVVVISLLGIASAALPFVLITLACIWLYQQIS